MKIYKSSVLKIWLRILRCQPSERYNQRVPSTLFLFYSNWEQLFSNTVYQTILLTMRHYHYQKKWCILMWLWIFFCSNECLITNIACKKNFTVKLLVGLKPFFAYKHFSKSWAQKSHCWLFELYCKGCHIILKNHNYVKVKIKMKDYSDRGVLLSNFLPEKNWYLIC